MDGVVLERFAEIVSADELPTTLGDGAAQHLAFPVNDADRPCGNGYFPCNHTV